MTQSTFTFRVDEELKGAFAAVAKEQDRTAAQLMRVLMRGAVQDKQEAKEHDAWFREQVERGLREADDPNTVLIPNEEVLREWAEQRAELVKRAGDDAA